MATLAQEAHVQMKCRIRLDFTWGSSETGGGWHPSPSGLGSRGSGFPTFCSKLVSSGWGCHLAPVICRALAGGGQSSAIPSPTRSDPRLRSGLIADAPSPKRYRRLELPFSFEVAAA